MAQEIVDIYGVMGWIQVSSDESGDEEGAQGGPDHPEVSSSDWGWDPAVERRWNQAVRDVDKFQPEREERRGAGEAEVRPGGGSAPPGRPQ
jgi:hypothetical protein